MSAVFATAVVTLIVIGLRGLWLPHALIPATIFCLGNGVLAAVRYRRSPEVSPAPTPADPLLARDLQWTQAPGDTRQYFADVDGVQWELDVDRSNQGIRYIIKAGGRYVREVSWLPKGWVLHPLP